MHRSGTSLAAEMVHRWGAFGRVEACLPPNQWNSRGYWELAPLVDLNSRLLAEVGASWNLPPNQKADARLKELAREPEYRRQASGLLASMKQEQTGSWFWKDPRLSLLLPFWQGLWSDIRYVICVRDPLEICLSLQERDGLSFSVSLLLWQRYMLSILHWTRNTPAIVMNYSSILRSPAEECERLARFLQSSGAPRDSDQVTSEMKRAVDRELRHCKAERRNASVTLTKRQQRLYLTLKRLASGQTSAHHDLDVDLDRCSLPRTWRGALKGNLLLSRCQQRWLRMFPDPAAAWEQPGLPNAYDIAGPELDIARGQRTCIALDPNQPYL